MVSELLTNVTTAIPNGLQQAMDVKSAIDGLNKFLTGVFGSAALTVGLIAIFIGIVLLFHGVIAAYRKQPTGHSFIFAVIALIIGGILVAPSAFELVRRFSQKTGTGTLDELQK